MENMLVVISLVVVGLSSSGIKYKNEPVVVGGNSSIRWVNVEPDNNIGNEGAVSGELEDSEHDNGGWYMFNPSWPPTDFHFDDNGRIIPSNGAAAEDQLTWPGTKKVPKEGSDYMAMSEGDVQGDAKETNANGDMIEKPNQDLVQSEEDEDKATDYPDLAPKEAYKDDELIKSKTKGATKQPDSGEADQEHELLEDNDGKADGDSAKLYVLKVKIRRRRNKRKAVYIVIEPRTTVE